jgi:hypothetical protein
MTIQEKIAREKLRALQRTQDRDLLAPNRLLRYITECKDLNATYIITGAPGPTGKTWLYKGLIHFGYTAFELSESTHFLVEYRDQDNHIIIDDEQNLIIIVLNKPLNRQD